MIKFQALNNKLLVRRAAEIKRTAGGLLVPDVAKDKALRGEVLATAEDICSVAVGDIVTFGRYAGVEMAQQGEEFRDCLLLAFEDIYGILNGYHGVELEVVATPQDDE